jgi:hypothetical protein
VESALLVLPGPALLFVKRQEDILDLESGSMVGGENKRGEHY